MRINLKPIFFLFLFGTSLNTIAQRTMETSQTSRGTGMNQSDVQNRDNNDESKSSSSADEKVVASRIRTWQIDDFLGERTAVEPDTLPLNFQNMTFAERNKTLSSENLGNLGSPFQTKIFSDRTEKTPFLFMRPYDNWIKAPDEQLFYNTTTPYTNIDYFTTFGDETSQEENFKVLFTVNANKYLNVGFDYEILYARGYYNKNSTRDKLANFFGNYQSPRYEAFWKLSSFNLENLENGGITDDRYITDPLLMSGGLQEYESLSIPVALEDARSLVKSRNFFFNHKYHIGFERTTIKKDTVDAKSAKNDTITEFIPVTSIIHTLYIDQSRKVIAQQVPTLLIMTALPILMTATRQTPVPCSKSEIRSGFP